MKKYFRLIALMFILNLTASSQVLALGQETTAASPIIKAIQHSGFTTPEATFENYCEVSESGQMIGYSHSGWIGNGWAKALPYILQLKPKTLAKIKLAILSASQGVISSGPRVCDRGTTDISARVDSESVPYVVVQAIDCETTQLNEHRAAQTLRSFVEKQCKIKY